MSATRKSPFARRDFRLLWLGEAVSALGDQFALVALPADRSPVSDAQSGRGLWLSSAVAQSPPLALGQ